MLKEGVEIAATRVLTGESPRVIKETAAVVAGGGIAVMQIEGPMYGFVGNVAEERVAEMIWNLKGRSWVGRPVESTVGIQKPVTGVTPQRLSEFVDWKLLDLSIDDHLVETLVKAGAHLVLPVRNGVVPCHLLTYHGEIPTLSMMPVEENDSTLGAIVCQLEKNSPRVIVGGSSANKTGETVFTEFQPLMQLFGGQFEIIIQGEDLAYDAVRDRRAFQRAMALILPGEIRIIREGLGLEQLRSGLSLFTSPLEPQNK